MEKYCFIFLHARKFVVVTTIDTYWTFFTFLWSNKNFFRSFGGCRPSGLCTQPAPVLPLFEKLSCTAETATSENSQVYHTEIRAVRRLCCQFNCSSPTVSSGEYIFVVFRLMCRSIIILHKYFPWFSVLPFVKDGRYNLVNKHLFAARTINIPWFEFDRPSERFFELLFGGNSSDKGHYPSSSLKATSPSSSLLGRATVAR